MAIQNKIISFWKQVKLKSSDMFTQFRVGVGVKVPTHKLHVKDSTDPVKIEGLQNDATDPDKFLTIDSSNIVKYRTGAQVLTDIGGTPLTAEQVQDIAGALVATGGTKTNIAVTYDDASGNMDFVVASDLNTTGSAATLTTARTIGGVSFNGSANIDLPGVNETGDQDTSGNALTATTLATARNINGVSFNGSAPITITAAGSTLSDTVPVSKGGTGATSFADKAVIITQDSGTDTLAAVAMSTNGQLLIGGTDGPAVATLTQGSGLTITNANGGITIAVDGDIDTTGESGTVDNIGNLTGDVTSSNRATTIANDAVTYAKMQNVSATNVVLGRDSAGAGVVEEISAANLRTIINVEDGATADQTQADINGLGITAIGVTGTTDADVEITSDGEVTVKLDADNDETNQKFKVVNNSGTERFSINENGVATFTGDVTVNEKITNSGTDNDLTFESDGSMTFTIDRDNDETSQSFSFKNYNVEVANLDEAGNLQIDGDLTVTGNDIKDDDGTTCITFDSSGNTTVSNTLNATLTGNVTGNASGSSGSCTGNSATATALTAGNKTIDGSLDIGSNTAGHDFAVYGATTNFSKMQWDASQDHLHFSDQAKIVFGTGGGPGGSDSSIQADGSNLVITNSAGNIQIGDTVEITGDLDVTGSVLPGITYIKILHSDFIADDVGRPAQIDDTGSDRWLKSHSTAKLYASVEIPLGFKATHVDVYGSGTSAVTVYEADIDSKTVTSKGTGNIQTQIDITDVTADATNYLLIELAQTSSEEVYGGKITIAKA